MPRREYDAYYTDRAITYALLKHVHIEGGVLEPCAGEGHIYDVLNAVPSVEYMVANDIRYNKRWDYQLDATEKGTRLWQIGHKWLVTNPPAVYAAQILEAAWSSPIRHMAMLLRLSFLEPTTGTKVWYPRKHILKDALPFMTHLIVLGSPRPSFTGDGNTDSVTMAWFVWDKYSDVDGCRIVAEPDWQREVTDADIVRLTSLF